MKAFRKILAPGGYLLIFEPMLRPGESREEFLERFREICRSGWTRLGVEEREAVIGHVETADFPESIDTLREMASEAGFSGVESLCRDPSGLFELLSFPSAAPCGR